MIEVFYTGVQTETIDQIKLYLGNSEIKLIEIPESALEADSQKSDAYIIGEKVENPIKKAQVLYKKDKNLSVLIIKEPDSYHKFKQALMFTPFIGSSIKLVSNDDFVELASVITEVSNNTINRRKYEFLKADVVPINATPSIESFKRAYIDRFYDEAPIGALLVDEKGTILTINHYLTKIINKSEEEILGKPLYSFFSEEKEVERFINKKETEVTKGIFKRSEKNYQYFELKVSEITDTYFTGFKSVLLSDVTERVDARRKIEEQLEELNTSNEELKKVNSDLDSFIYTASHDLKAPVSNIEGLVYTLRDSLEGEYGSIKPEATTLLEMIDSSIERFKDTLLDLTEVIKTQRVEEQAVKEIECDKIIEDVKILLQNEIEATGAELVTEVSECNHIIFSKKNFRSIMYNLISNAIKYRSPKRQLKVEIIAKSEEEYCVISVIDNGLGVSPENMAKMFTMFKRFHNHVEGTGIGLFIVKRLIENSGGKIEVESELGKGTTFNIYFRKNI